MVGHRFCIFNEQLWWDRASQQILWKWKIIVGGKDKRFKAWQSHHFLSISLRSLCHPPMSATTKRLLILLSFHAAASTLLCILLSLLHLLNLFLSPAVLWFHGVLVLARISIIKHFYCHWHFIKLNSWILWIFLHFFWLSIRCATEDNNKNRNISISNSFWVTLSETPVVRRMTSIQRNGKAGRRDVEGEKSLQAFSLFICALHFIYVYI